MAQTLARAIIDYISTLEVTQGDHVGERFTVLPWEQRFIRGAWSTTGDAALSVGRGNGKSGLVSAISACYLPPGPLAAPRGEVVCCASSFGQSRIIFEELLAMVDVSDRDEWRKQDSQNMASIEHRATGARVRCIGSDPARAHGLKPILALLDEPAQWEAGKRAKMLAALKTSLGKIPGSRMIALGTQPDDDEHFFAKMLDDPDVFSMLFAASKDDPPFQKRTWLKANPSLKHMPTLERRIRQEAKEAKRDPAALAGFRALRLNLGTSDVTERLLIEADVWGSIENRSTYLDGPCYWGIDLGTTAAQSAIAAYWPETGRLDAVAAFPRVPDLRERGRLDGVDRLYIQCNEDGELLQLGNHTTDVGALLGEALIRFGTPVSIACDRWREGELRDALETANIPLAHLVIRGQGFKDGSEDVRDFRRAIMQGEVRAYPRRLMAYAMSEARVVSDPAGNEKLAKATQGGRRARARDDAAAAAILAVATGYRRPKLKLVSNGGIYLGTT